MKANKIIQNLGRYLVVTLVLFSFSSCEQEDDNFTDVVPDIAEAIIRNFTIAGQQAAIDHSLATISATLPSGTDLSAVTVEISLPETASVTPASGSTLDFSDGPVIFKVTSTNGATREYTATLGAFGNPLILEFSIGDNTGVIDQQAGTIEVEIGSQDGNLSSLAPTFSIAEGTTVDKLSGISQNFTGPVTYTVLSNDGYTAKEYVVTVTQIEAPIISAFSINGVTGIIDNAAESILVVLPAGTDASALIPEITIPEGQTVDPASGVAQDFSSGPVNYTVTNVENLTKTYAVTAEVIAPTKYAFLGLDDSIENTVDDDAKAAATWMRDTYGDDFKYIQISQLTAAEIAEVKVAMLYYLTPAEDLGFFATATDVSTMLPSELRPGAAQAEILKSWVKGGGDMLIAGDPTPFIFSLGRVPANFGQPRAPGNYVYSEFGCAGSTGCIDTGKPANDIWGLGMRPANNSQDRQGDAIFNGLTFENGEFLALQNSATREVRLIWWQHFDNILNPSCCGQDAALFFEQTFSATKYGTLSFVGDAFGYGAIEWKRTDQANDANFDAQIGTDFKGHVFSIENTIIGYEWDSNGTVNDFQSNIETFTKNIIDYLFAIDND
jgi:hypothetical protein